MRGQIQGDFGKNCLSYLWPINVAVLDINTANETKLAFTFYTKRIFFEKGKVFEIVLNANNSNRKIQLAGWLAEHEEEQ